MFVKTSGHYAIIFMRLWRVKKDEYLASYSYHSHKNWNDWKSCKLNFRFYVWCRVNFKKSLLPQLTVSDSYYIFIYFDCISDYFIQQWRLASDKPYNNSRSTTQNAFGIAFLQATPNETSQIQNDIKTISDYGREKAMPPWIMFVFHTHDIDCINWNSYLFKMLVRLPPNCWHKSRAWGWVVADTK